MVTSGAPVITIFPYLKTYTKYPLTEYPTSKNRTKSSNKHWSASAALPNIGRGY